MNYSQGQIKLWGQVKNDKRLWLMPLVVGGVVFGLLIGAVMPMIQNVQTDMNQIKVQEEKLARYVAKRTALQALNESKITQELVAVNRVLPSNKPILAVINTLAGVASSSAVLLDGYTFAPGLIASEAAAKGQDQPAQSAEKKGELIAMPVKSGVSGSYLAMMTYLTALSQAAPLIRVNQGEITGAIEPQLAQTDNLSVSLLLSSYYAPPPTNLGALEEPLPPMTDKTNEIMNRLNEFQSFQASNDLPVTTESRGNLFGF